MKIRCKIFGHTWNKTDKYRQPCKHCTAIRFRVVDKIKQLTGEKCINWEIKDIGSLKFKK